MHTSFLTVLSLLLAVGAQHSEETETAAPIDPGCQSFLDSLDTNDSLGQCLSSIKAATARFNSTGTAASSTEIEATLTDLCDAGCDRGEVVSLVLQFGRACKDDLVTNQDVSSVYDMVYNLEPMRASLCSKDSGSYCMLNKDIVGSSANLVAPEGDAAAIVTANLDAWGTANVGFLFLTPASPTSALCSACFQNVLAGYVDYEDGMPYAIGVGQSPLLQGQSKVWRAVTSSCSAEVANNVAVKGGTAPPPVSAASARVAAPFLAGAATLGAGLVVLAL